MSETDPTQAEIEYYASLDIVGHGDRTGPALARKILELQKFKAFVHKRLDEMGIPTHPDGKHSKEGCRIGDRLDIVERKLQDLDETNAMMQERD